MKYVPAKDLRVSKKRERFHLILHSNLSILKFSSHFVLKHHTLHIGLIEERAHSTSSITYKEIYVQISNWNKNWIIPKSQRI